MFKPSKIDDKVVIIRAVLGVLYGFIAYIIYRLGFFLPSMDISGTIWLVAGFLYVVSAFYVQFKYGRNSLFLVFFRGLLTFYASWIIVFLLLYDLFG